MSFTTFNSVAPPGFQAVTNSSLYIADITLSNATIQPAIYLQLILDTSLFPGFVSFLRFSVLRNDRVQALFQFMDVNGQFSDGVTFLNVPVSSFPYEITLFFTRDDEVLTGIEEDATDGGFPFSDQFDINVIILGAVSGPLLLTPAADAQFTITRAEG